MNLEQKVKQVKNAVEKRKKEFSYDWLGRSLAYNNYPPRDVLSLLAKDQEMGFVCELGSDEDIAQSLKKAQDISTKVKAFSISMEKYTQEDISAFRRYLSTPLMQDDLIVDEYQLLEAVVYGADFIPLSPCILSKKELKDLLHFSRRLGMEPLVKIGSKQDLTHAIFAGAELLELENEDFLSLVPQGKVLLTKFPSNTQKADDLNLKGFDGFMISYEKLLEIKE